MAAHVTLSEIWRQLVQRCTGLYACNMPPLLQFRIWAYGRLFKAGRGCSYAHGVCFERHHGLDGRLVIGKHVQIGHDVTLDYSGGLTLEDHVWISEGSYILTHDHGLHGPGLKVDTLTLETNALTVGRDAWIGGHCIILPKASRIGEGAIVGAGSVVTKEVAPFDIVAGNPARVIGHRR